MGPSTSGYLIVCLIPSNFIHVHVFLKLEGQSEKSIVLEVASKFCRKQKKKKCNLLSCYHIGK